MEYNSFYGGRRGASFVIVKKYRTIKPPAEDNEGFNKVIRIDMGLAADAEITDAIRKQWLSDNCMVTCFQQGGDYEICGYNEYVIIDAYNKNDIDNGKIFRRGYDYTNEMGGAIYVGQIVGPAGMAPHTLLNNYDEILNMTTEDGLEGPTLNPDGTLVEDSKKNQYRKTANSLEVKNEGDPTSGDLIPGQYFDETGEHFNDTIDYVACSIRDFESHESIVHIGFKIPYLVNVYTSESVSPYYHRSDLEPVDKTGDEKWTAWDEASEKEYGDGTTEFNNKELIKRTDDLSHPFFEKWDIKIPKGIHGQNVNKLRVTTVGECEDEHPGWLQKYLGIEDDEIVEPIVKERKILVYDYYDYDRDPSGDPISIYLGDYNMIDNYNIDDYGTVTINYSHDDQDIYKNLFKWIKSITLDENDGHFVIEYNYDKTRDGEELAKEDTKLDINLTWIKDMTFAEDGTIKWIYTTSEDDHQKDNFIKWIEYVTLDAENGQFDIEFNYPTEPDYKDNAGDPTHYTTSLQWVKDISFADNGTVTLDYTNKDDTIYPNMIKWITSTKLNPETGRFEIDFNYPNEPTTDGTTGAATHYEESLQWVKNINIDEYGTMTTIYTNQPDRVDKNLFKWIKSISYEEETGLLTFEYNYDKTRDGEAVAKEDTTYTTYLRYVDNVVVDEDGTIHLEYTHGDEQKFSGVLKRIDSVTLDNTNGHLLVTYNTESTPGMKDQYQTDLDWVKDVNIDDEGTITFDYTVSSDKVYTKAIKSVKSVTLNNQTGHFVVEYNHATDKDGNPTKYETDLSWVTNLIVAADGTVTLKHSSGPDTVLPYKIKWLTDIAIDNGDTEGNGNQKVKVTYNDGTVAEIGKPLNYIMKTAISDDHHLLILHADPAKRAEYKANGQNATWEGRDDWQDAGNIKDDAGILVGLNLTAADHPELANTNTAIDYLNNTYPNGLTGLNLEGKIVTVGDTADYKSFYAFDYSKKEDGTYNGWYYLGNIGSTSGIVVGAEGDSSTIAQASQMPTNGIWLVVEE